jgi:hypothetical protein
MTSTLIAASVIAVAALTSQAASAETFNPYLWDQMKTASTKTRAEVKAEVTRAKQGDSSASSSSSFNGASEQQKLGATSLDRPDATSQAKALPQKTGAQ